MRALVCTQYGPPDGLVIEERPEPVVGEGEVRIDVAAAGINFPDVLVIAGQYQVKTPPPFVPGSELAGVVGAVGPGVKRLQPGDRVIATATQGAFAEQCVVAERACTPLPAALSFEQGAGFTITYATAYHAFCQSTDLKAGETVLVLGAAGGVGVAAVEVAKALGASVIAAASSAEKLQFAQEAGADQVINYSDVSLREAVRELTGGKGVEVVFDPVGGALAEQAYRSLAWHGRYLVIGFASGDIPNFAANIALLKEAALIGVWWGTWTRHHPQDAVANMQELARLAESGVLNPRVTASYPLDRYVDAFAAITERRALGKVVLTM